MYLPKLELVHRLRYAVPESLELYGLAAVVHAYPVLGSPLAGAERLDGRHPVNLKGYLHLIVLPVADVVGGKLVAEDALEAAEDGTLATVGWADDERQPVNVQGEILPWLEVFASQAHKLIILQSKKSPHFGSTQMYT